MRKGLAQRVSDRVVAELKVNCERVALIGAMADDFVEDVDVVEVAVLTDSDVDYFGEEIELCVDTAIRRMLDAGDLHEAEDIEHEHDCDDARSFQDNRKGIPVLICVCEHISDYEALVE